MNLHDYENLIKKTMRSENESCSINSNKTRK